MNASIRTCRAAAVVLALFAPLACAHINRAPSGYDVSDDDIITEEAIARAHAVNAYDAIVKIRANFLSFRGRTSLMGTSQPDPTVYMDDVPYGTMSALKTIPAEQVSMIRLYRAGQASTKFGMGNMGGVIEVSTKH